MISWAEFKNDNPALTRHGSRLFFTNHASVGHAFIATVRKDGAPRLHPICLVTYNDHLYVLVPPSSPKCSDLRLDGRFALQAFPPPDNVEGEEFLLSGKVVSISDINLRMKLISGTKIQVEESEILFELLLDRVMYTKLVNRGTPAEYPEHQIWNAPD